MPSRICLSSFNPSRVREACKRAEEFCLLRHAPVIDEAPEKIAHIRNFDNFESMEGAHSAFTAGIVQVRMTNPAPWIFEMLLSSPDNYCRKLLDFIGIDTTLQLIFEGQTNIAGLQLAANYGPFIWHLNNNYGWNGFTGVDVDRWALEYAGNNAIPIQNMSAVNLTFPSNHFDVVISSNFLEKRYLDAIQVQLLAQRQATITPLLNNILAGIHRVLKPGGFFISDKETFAETGNTGKEWPFFGQADMFSSEITRDLSTFGLEKIAVFQKAG